MRIPISLAARSLILPLVLAFLALPAGGGPGRAEFVLLDLRLAIARLVEARGPVVETVVLLVTPQTEARLGEAYSSRWRRWYPDMVRLLSDARARLVVWDATFLAQEPDLDGPLLESFSLLPVIGSESEIERNTNPLRSALAGVGWRKLSVTHGVPRSTLAAAPSGSDTVWIDSAVSPLEVPSFDLADVILADDKRLADEDRTPVSVFTDRMDFVGTDLPGSDRYPLPGSRGKPVALVALGGIAFVFWRVWLPWCAALLLVGAAIALVVASRRLRTSHEYRMSIGFDSAILEDRISERALTDGVERPATVLCSDIRNYSQFVADAPTRDVQRVMTQYMEAMERIVHEFGGYVNKFVGDEIVAVFGFPLGDESHEGRAVRAAREMLIAIYELNARWTIDGLPGLDGIVIGVDTGPLRFIRIGTVRRLRFDVIGAPINGANRLVGLTGRMGRPLVVSSEVTAAQRVFSVAEHGIGPDDGEVRDELDFIGEVMIRGQGRRRLFGIQP